MKLQYLGTAAAEGVPGLFCRCETCLKARERGGRELRSRSQAILNGNLLIDFPCDTFSHCTQHGIDLSSINHCLITHVHGDHTFPWEMYMLKKGYTHQGEDYEGFTLHGSEDVEGRFADPMKGSSNRLKIHTVAPFQPFEVCGVTVTALKANHTTAHPYIYLLEDGDRSILYGNDTDLFPEETWEYLGRWGKKFSLVSLDCTGGAADHIEKYTHMYLGANKRCRQRLEEMGLTDDSTRFVLTHFSHNGLTVNYKEFCDIVEPLGFEVAYDGMTVTL